MNQRRRCDPAAVDAGEAKDFLRSFYAENPAPAGDIRSRARDIARSIRRTGTYQHTTEELAWAARVAWRHAARCTGRSPWRTLRIRDRRQTSASEEVAAETFAHLRETTNGGKIRSMITVFAPGVPGRPVPQIVNSQILRYAGYASPASEVIGDPQNIALTELAARLGWAGKGGRFDLLPLIVTGPGGQERAYPVPPDAVLEVPVSHPQLHWFAELGLRWYAVPAISDMMLDAGGIRYPCVFSGWYQADTEVGVRDLGDAGRYDVLPEIAKRMGLDVSSVSTLWPDRAVVELAVAVAHSFRVAGVMATDHQSEALRCAAFITAEEKAGRACPVDWAWVVPPVGGSTTPLFHRDPARPVPAVKPGFIRRSGPPR
jgi:nitric-oxide synthase